MSTPIEIAVMPKTVMIDRTPSLSRVKVSPGIKLEWDSIYGTKGSYLGQTDKVDTPRVLLSLRVSNNVMRVEITEDEIIDMLDYVRKVKQQVGKQINYEYSFQV